MRWALTVTRRSINRGEDPLLQLGRLPAGLRQGLLRVLSSSSNVRADVIRQLYARPKARTTTETLIDLEEDELLRERLVLMLEATFRDGPARGESNANRR